MTPEFTHAPFGPLACALVAVVLAGMGPGRADSVVVFNEIQYNPWDLADAEWIELHNQMAIDVDISDWKIRGGVDLTFRPARSSRRAGICWCPGIRPGSGLAGPSALGRGLCPTEASVCGCATTRAG